MGQLKKAKFVEDGCYAQVTSKDGLNSYIFRKFDTGLWIGHVAQKDPSVLTDMIMIPKDILDVIKNAPEIKEGDGKTPQLLAEDLKDDTRQY